MMQQRNIIGWFVLLFAAALLLSWRLAEVPGATATQFVAVTNSDIPSDTAIQVRFQPLNIYFDTGTHPLAAYQFELKTLVGNVAIVGVEGGDALPFQPAPFYDLAALQHNRVIIGAFSTDPHVPMGKNRVARVHVMVTGSVAPQYQIVVQAAATTDGSPIQATATIEEGTKP